MVTDILMHHHHPLSISYLWRFDKTQRVKTKNTFWCKLILGLLTHWGPGISGPRCRLLLGSLLKDLWGQGKIIGIFRKKGVLFQNIYAATNLQTFNDQFGRCCDGTSYELLLKVASCWFSVTSTLARCRDNGTGVWHKLEIMFSLVSSSGKQQGGA